MTIACRSVECKKHGTEHSITIINGKCNDYEPKPKEIERLQYIPGTSIPRKRNGEEVIDKDHLFVMVFNELIDAVNELRRRE